LPSGRRTDGSNLNDVTAALLTHVRKNRPGQINHTPAIGFVPSHELLIGHSLERTQEAIARIIDQHINASESLHGDGHGVLDVFWGGNVQLHSPFGHLVANLEK